MVDTSIEEKLNKFLYSYVDYLYDNSNVNIDLEQKNLVSKVEYYKILKPVISLYLNNLEKDIDELRNILYKNSELENIIKKFIFDKKMCSGLVLTYGTMNYQEYIVIGNKCEIDFDTNLNKYNKIESIDKDAIFDLASLTKVFTSVSIYKLVSLNKISLNDKITKYLPEFKYLNGVTIFDLLTFQVKLETDKRINEASNANEAFEILKNASVKDRNPKRRYNDINAMVLKYVIEKVSELTYYEFLEKYILKSLDMTNTFVCVPNNKKNLIVSTNGGVKLYKDNNYKIEKYSKGLVHDEKARVFVKDNLFDLSGHAGLFSNATDMSKLAKGLINNIIINEELFKELCKNRTGKKYLEDGQEKYTQYFASLCYSKNPVKINSELTHLASGISFAMEGYTGVELTVDYLNKLYLFLGGNKTHNRVIVNEIGYKELESGEKEVMVPNNKVYTDSTKFAWDKGDIVDESFILLLQYKMLEDLFNYFNKEFNYQEKVRVLKK